MILNRVAGEGHYRMLEAAIVASCKTPLLGWMPRESAITIPERHFGLHTAEGLGDHELKDVTSDEALRAGREALRLAKILGLGAAWSGMQFPSDRFW